MALVNVLSRLALLAVLSPLVHADDKAHTWYRYYDAQGLPTLSDQISETHIVRGYEILNANLQVVRRLPPFDETAYQHDRVRREAALRQQQEDARILRLYSSARDAELALQRKIDTLETTIGYDGIQLMRLKRFRADSVEAAAQQERTGQRATDKVAQQISVYDRQISDVQAAIEHNRAEQAKARGDFAPIVARLRTLEQNTTLAAMEAPTR